MMKLLTISAATLLMTSLSTTALSATVVMEKRNTNFSIDGGNGSAQNRQIYLWNTNTSNVNQQWEETQVDGRYYTYQKVGTPRCIDGGDGAARRQAVTLRTCNASDRNQHWEKKAQAGGTFRLKKRGFSFSIDGKGGAARRQTLHLWNSSDSNANQHWSFNTVGGGGNNGGGDFGLNPNDDPWENFDLINEWALDTPAPRSNDGCRAERTEEDEWNNLSNASRQFITTHTDGGMRFTTRIDGQTTNDNCNSGFVRSELREMLRGGNTNIDDTGVTQNNWKLGYQPGNANNWGGENGEMNATLRVNRVTTSGDSGQVGRVIIGQIHADNDEPLRLYYRKRSGQSNGCIYFAHEIRDDDDINFEMIGDRNCTSGPSNGIELDELFSYTIINDDEDLTVIIRRGDNDGPIIAQRTIDMNSLNSDYDRSDEWMYFKAGAYTQNDSGNGSDGDTVTFYRLSKSHD